MMTDLPDRVSLALIEAGDHKDRVIHVLSKVKGLSMAPEQIVNSTPCTIATNVPRHLAEKLQGFLEQVGAMVLLESEDALFSAADLPMPAEEENKLPAPDDFASSDEQEDFASSGPEEEFSEGFPPLVEEDWMADAFPQASTRDNELMGDFQAAPLGGAGPEVDEDEQAEYDFEQEPEASEAAPASRFSQLLARWSKGKKPKQKQPAGAAPPERAKKKLTLPTFSLPKFGKSRDKEPEEDRTGVPKKSSFFVGFRKPASEAEPSSVQTQEPQFAADEGERARKKFIPDQALSYLLPALVGFLCGAIIMGVWGWASIRATQREVEAETDRRMQQFDQQVAQQIEQHSAGLKALVVEQQATIDQLTRQNAELVKQSSQTPLGITPSLEPVAALPAEAAIVSAFEELKTRHAQSLENASEAQQRAKCSRQVLLDGKSTEAYAQIVRTFTAKYTSYDVMRSTSLLTPYLAEFKIPFQEEIRTGGSEDACNAAQLRRMPTATMHHEFGSFYGYWIIQYEYKQGKWRVKPTVIEKNRDLYASAFQSGSPDFAKFLLDTALFPEFKQE
ncbi:hypothetical protein U27_04256 [Candidatus Vecturithrix granuli]|uniref:Ribosomal protein L7/L12 C-terminal domain-containing protein n=1 Tax=Vecturithrix granuli TaxID=1499967 RepID=A0A081BY86_VECG1|nr:hypothetical protein U27_04256 [Candidatus Vecturithrix granuli]